jgi:Flp pilus assembly pilin Flp
LLLSTIAPKSLRGDVVQVLWSRLRHAADAPRHRTEDGATATEYGLLVVFIALTIAVGVGAFGVALNGAFMGFGTWVTETVGSNL